MKTLCDYHVHTAFSDGRNTPEEMVLSAIEKGLKEIGFSDHSYTFFDESYCIKKDKIKEYKCEIVRLKEKYAGKIKILCGIEQDFYSTESVSGYDYAIGSVHYVKKGEKYLAVDENAEDFIGKTKRYYDGDYYAFCKDYFDTVAKFAERKEIKIIGHFDLITKYNEGYALFSESDPRYLSAWQSAADKLIAAGKTFEINTHALKNGLKTQPYPSDEIMAYIKTKGGKFILSSDSHNRYALCFGFDKYEYRAI